MRSWLKRRWAWIGKRLKDLFYNVGNKNLDLGRVLSFFAVIAPLTAALWNASLGKEIPLKDFGLGIAAVVGACAALIAMKDSQARKTNEQISEEAGREA